jgi:hypothetical protein
MLVIMMIQACSAERRLANKIVKVGDSISVCIIDPWILYKYNMKTWEIPKYDSLPENTRDSLVYFNSKYLQFVKDSLFLGLYLENLKETLKTYGIRVYSQDSINAFLASGGKAYLFNLGQITLEEYLDPVKKTFALDTTSSWEIWCNAVGVNVWYEASVLNVNDTARKVLFANMYVRDKITGHFEGDFFNGGVINYVYQKDTISLKSVYNLATRSSKDHAAYIFDYILNDLISRKTISGSPPAEYLHYDPIKKKLVKAGNKRFSIIK